MSKVFLHDAASAVRNKLSCEGVRALKFAIPPGDGAVSVAAGSTGEVNAVLPDVEAPPVRLPTVSPVSEIAYVDDEVSKVEVSAVVGDSTSQCWTADSLRQPSTCDFRWLTMTSASGG